MLGTGDRGGAVGGEEEDELGNLAGTSGPSQRNAPSESMSCSRAASVSIPCPLAMRSTNASADAVWMKPGATELTRTPWGATSLARPLLYVVNAALAAAYPSVAL